jgi:hypothetical protein
VTAVNAVDGNARLTPADITSRRMVDAIHIDYSRSESAWMGNVEGVPRLSVSKGRDRTGAFMRWYVDQKPVRDLEAALAVINGDVPLEAAMLQEEKPKPKISLSSQIAEIDRELSQRKAVYPRMVAGRGMRQGIADLQIAHLQAVRDTLAWLKENENMIKQRLAQ